MTPDIIKLKVTKTTYCEVCGEKLKRQKTFTTKVIDGDIEAAKKYLTDKANEWKLSRKQKHCFICWSIVKSVEGE